MKTPERGEVWLVDLGLAAKIRPCLVVSIPASDADRSIVTLVPHTTSVRGSRFEVALTLRFLKPGAFDIQSITTVPLVYLVRRLGVLFPSQIQGIDSGLRSWLGIEPHP